MSNLSKMQKDNFLFDNVYIANVDNGCIAIFDNECIAIFDNESPSSMILRHTFYNIFI